MIAPALAAAATTKPPAVHVIHKYVVHACVRFCRSSSSTQSLTLTRHTVDRYYANKFTFTSEIAHNNVREYLTRAHNLNLAQLKQ